MYKYVKRKGSIILVVFVVLLLFYSSMLTSMGRRSAEVTSDAQDIGHHIQRINNIMFDELVRLQTIHLETIRTAFHDWNWDFIRGDFLQIYERFISRTIAPFPGIDGKKHVLVYMDGKILFDGNGNMLFESPHFFDSREYLHPYFITTGADLNAGNFGDGNRYIWNKIILPSPSSPHKKIHVLIGFSEKVIWDRDEGNSDAIHQKAISIKSGGERFLLYTIVWLVVTAIAAYVIMAQLKQAEFDAYIQDIQRGGDDN